MCFSMLLSNGQRHVTNLGGPLVAFRSAITSVTTTHTYSYTEVSSWVANVEKRGDRIDNNRQRENRRGTGVTV